MNVLIRRATLDDLELLAPLFDAYRQFYACSPNLDNCRAFLRNRLDRDESVVFVAEADGRGAGMTQLYPSFTSIGMSRAWILNDLYVAAFARRKGVGRKLMEAARVFATEMNSAWLELATAKDNHAAQSLYHSLGYKLDEKYDRFKLTL